MDFLKTLILIGCAVAYVVSNEEFGERVRRQSGLNGAHTDAMRASSQGGFVHSYNPISVPNGFGGRLGAGYGTNVWSSGNRNVGVGGAIRSDLGLNNGRPFARSPELGVGATYNRGANSFGVGAGRTFGSRPSNQVGFSFSRRFKRSLEDEDNEQSIPAEFETQPLNVENVDEQEVFSEVVDDSDENEHGKRIRRQAMNSATINSLANKPVGRPQFSYQIDGAGNNRRNFGASGSIGAGVKAWERGPHSVGVGLGASGDLARFNGKTYTGNHQVGAGVGYQNGRFSATAGAGRTLGRFPSNHYGLNLGYRF